MKKTRTLFLTILAVLVLLLTMTACKDTTDGQGNETGGQETTPETVKEDKLDITDGVLTFREGNGVTFDQYSLYSTASAFPQVPQTYEAWIKLPKDITASSGEILGDYYNKTTSYFSLRVVENGVPELEYSNGEKVNEKLITTFDQVKLPADKWVYLAVVDDVTNGVISCYVDGELAQSVTLSTIRKNFARNTSKQPAGIGGDCRDGNTLAFKGAIRSLVTYKVTRTADEIKADMISVNLNDGKILTCHDIANSQGSVNLVDQRGKATFTNNRLTDDWISPEDVAELDDYDYSIAVIGDTQILAAYYPEKLPSIFDWLLKNKDTHKIEHVLNVGDFTNFNYDEEWELCVNQYFRLNGVIDYTLVRGDHDVKNDGINNGVDKNKYDRFFGVDAYTSRFNNENSGFCTVAGESMTNSYRRVTIGGIDYLIMTLDYDPSTSVIKWAKQVLDNNTSEKVIMTMHRYLMPNDSKTEEGQLVWKELASKYSNVQFVISGHKITENINLVKEKGENGNIVNQLLVNPQGDGLDNNGATGMVCMLYFKKGSDDVQVRYYSTCLDKYFRKENQIEFSMANLNSAKTAR